MPPATQPEAAADTPRTLSSRVSWFLWDAARFLLVAAVFSTGVGRWRGPLQEGTATDFELPTVDGDIISSSSFRGRDVVLNFWATWCGPCRAEMPLLAAWARRHPEVVVIGIAVDRDPDAVRKLLPSLDLPYTVVVDPRHEIADAYSVTSYPTTFRLDEDGRIEGSHVGVVFGPQLDLMDWW